MGASALAFAQNPHGENFQINCAACHNPEGWEIPDEHWKDIELHKPEKSEITGMPLPVDTSLFHHNKTEFPLEGRHRSVDCRSCHASLVFSDAESTCISCHTDMHQNTVGSDCARCHTTDNWLVNNITDLHVENGFPLLGPHAVANCFDCHTSETMLRFERIGNECLDCHLDEYEATTNPDHDAAGFSTNCIDCHDMTQFDWSTEVVDHSFFPLTKGHDITDCASCHVGGDFAGTSPACFSCHQSDFQATTEPDHEAANFVTDCATCHTTDPGWMPAEYADHDLAYFPIYSGGHEGTWSACADCHTDPGNYAEVSCIVCHLNPETDDFHDEVSGYAYINSACLACHPTGNADESFDHNETAFPLTGAHINTDCIACHASGYADTPTECAACHSEDFQETTNPNHSGIGLSMDCASCHTTDPGWMPAGFAIHDDFYALNGAHALIANDCASCHNGNYVTTPNTCFGCHAEDYNATTDPNHQSAQFSTDCATCHSELVWEPSTFDHDAQYFPIYSGAHNGEWSQCTDCHTNLSNYPEVNCINCHINPETNDAHEEVNGYVFENTACLACHPTGDVTNIFDHSMTAFPLTGAHITTTCTECHATGYEGTPTECSACHQVDYNQTTNPNHSGIGLSTDCASCHTTDPGWMPAGFPVHNEYYALNGAHAAIANDCAACHNGDYVNTPNTCYGCHATDYTATTDPAHQQLQFPTDCASCHTETAWTPSIFDHNNFYPFTGAHQAIADDCNACHNGNYTNTPNTCVGCHNEDYNETTNPGHTALALPFECESCHTTEPGWMPAGFPIHDDYYALNGAHAVIANDCATCHGGDYNMTPNTCFGCHSEDYNQTTDPNHSTAQFSTDCASCHTESAWVPSTFDHDAQYFPIYSGEHNGEWSQCTDCHTNPANYPEVSCIACHLNPETDEEHAGVNGYSYNNSSCLACHPTGSAEDNFDHSNTGFPLTGAHVTAECIDCHAAGYAGTPTDCASCHTDDYNQSTNPNHVGLALPTDCAMCHTTEPGWMPASFEIHNEYYVLEGAHAPLANECATCHNGDYNNTPNTCNGCHADDYNQAMDPNHATNQFPVTCEDCHTQVAWEPSTFDHEAFYPFTGAHIPIANDCAACHNGDYMNTPNTCAGCHTDDYNESTNPGHTALGIPMECETCHTTEPGWMPAGFPIHNEYYVLEGAHAGIANDCATCHNGDYNNTPNTCFGCHADDYNATVDPDHQVNQFPVTCEDCHTATAWIPSTFDHNAIYPFEGAHIAIANDCVACHNGDYTNTPNTCNGCHTDDYNATVDPDHEVNQFPVTCEQCHTQSEWVPSIFDHAAYYPFTGAHIPIANDCNACHNGDYANTPNTCAGCHTLDYNASSNPDHQALGIPTDCQSCHTTDPDWMPATFAIHNDYWPLNGAHAIIADDCVTCHNGDYNNTPNTCFGCHANDYNATTNPDHAEAAFPTTCDDCHTESGWVPANFDHDIFYPLVGAHEVIENECAMCHIGGNYSNTPNTCFGCHENDYNQTTNPDHDEASFPTTCDDCHTETAWIPANFDHDIFYPLTGAHEVIENDCALCHIGGNYSNTPNTCEGCHITDYNESINPDHSNLAIPTDCDMCHSTDPDWMPATFPIHNNYWALNGAHAAISNDCAVCHAGDYNNTPNTCFGCHADDYNQTNDPDHADVGFPTTCENCHTENAWVPSNWNHDQLYFPIYSGRHEGEWNDCIDCHIGGNFNSFSCIDCHEHDDPVDLADEHDEVPGYIYSSPACYSCHPTGED